MTREAVQRRTVHTLMATNALGYAGFIAVLAVVGLLTSEITGDDSLAGIPQAVAILGTAAAATPLALRSKRKGRRRGLWLGYLIGAVGGTVAFIGGQSAAFLVLVAGMALFGVGNASNMQSRFAAADLAPDAGRARAIAMVVWVGTIGAVLGSPAALWVNRIGVGRSLEEWVSPSLLGVVAFLLAGAVVAAFLRPDPLELAGGVDPDAPRENPLRGASRSLSVVWPNTGARLAIVAMAVSQMAMVAVMVMTPLHMKDHGHAELSTIVIAVHVLGMFGLAPLVGRWADRFGRIRALQFGAVILGTGTLAAVAAGYVPALLFAGLFLLGVGWSFSLIAGSALLTESLPLTERVGAQGLADVTVSLLGASAALMSGFVKEMAGFHWLANFATITAVLMLVAATRVGRSRSRISA